jgi:4-aminobutyrate aminotransferase-like enzyme
MRSWGVSSGDASHTSTFLGNPLGCAVALATIKEIEEQKLVDRSKNLGDFFRKELWKLKEKYPLVEDVRGSGLMIGMELSDTEKAKTFIAEALRQGVVLLPSGASGNVLAITPPLIITEKEISFCIGLFNKILSKIGQT